jgi:hypothetical protein
MSHAIVDSNELEQHAIDATARSEIPIGGGADPGRLQPGRFRVVLGNGFARDTVVVRYGGVEVPVGAADEHLGIEVVGRLLSGSVELAPPSAGEVTVEVHLNQFDVQVLP